MSNQMLKEAQVSSADVLAALESIKAMIPEPELIGADEAAALLLGLPAEALFHPVEYRWMTEEGYAKLFQLDDTSGRKLSKKS